MGQHDRFPPHFQTMFLWVCLGGIRNLGIGGYLDSEREYMLGYRHEKKAKTDGPQDVPDRKS